jgi:Flp pilus assembly pilin Flp
MITVVCTIWKDDRGQDTAEYAGMLALILVLVLGTVKQAGSKRQQRVLFCRQFATVVWPKPLLGSLRLRRSTQPPAFRRFDRWVINSWRAFAPCYSYVRTKRVYASRAAALVTMSALGGSVTPSPASC